MPIRFRRTLKIAPGVKINFSKSGMSTTVGPKGFHFTFGKRGIRRTVGIPGTGISEVDYIKKNETKAEKEREDRAQERSVEARAEKKEPRAIPVTGHARVGAVHDSATGLRNTFVLLAVLVFFCAGAAVLGLIPTGFLSNALLYFRHLVQGVVH